MKLNNNDDSHNSGLNLLIYNMLLDIESHPAWVCGLKPCTVISIPLAVNVTPCVGVWIETIFRSVISPPNHVTPCVGVWIETPLQKRNVLIGFVTPCVGVWIETADKSGYRVKTLSHPAWVCGLKRS